MFLWDFPFRSDIFFSGLLFPFLGGGGGVRPPHVKIFAYSGQFLQFRFPLGSPTFQPLRISFAKFDPKKLKFVGILLVDTTTDWCPFLMKSSEQKEIEKQPLSLLCHAIFPYWVWIQAILDWQVCDWPKGGSQSTRMVWVRYSSHCLPLNYRSLFPSLTGSSEPIFTRIINYL